MFAISTLLSAPWVFAELSRVLLEIIRMAGLKSLCTLTDCVFTFNQQISNFMNLSNTSSVHSTLQKNIA